MKFACLALTAALALAAPSLAQTSPEPAVTVAADAEVRQAFDAFMTAFNDADEAAFGAAWASDATVFFPAPVFGVRLIEGKDAVLERFFALFTRARQARPAPPYLNIRPVDVQIRQHGDSAVATFHLEGQDATGRRTVVFQRQADGWRIVHMHASSLDLPAAGG